MTSYGACADSDKKRRGGEARFRKGRFGTIGAGFPSCKGCCHARFPRSAYNLKSRLHISHIPAPALVGARPFCLLAALAGVAAGFVSLSGKSRWRSRS